MKGLKLNACQLALFVGSGSIRADELSFEVRKHLDIGEYDPMLIPEAPGMPAEFPRLQISTPKGFQLAMSRARLDFMLSLPLGIDEPDFLGFVDKCGKLLDVLHEHTYRYSRIGFIKTYFADSNNAGGIVEKLIKVQMGPLDEVNVSLTKKIELEGRKCNSLYNFANGVNASGDFGLLVARDLNTDAGVINSFDSKEAKAFIASVVPLASSESVYEFLG